MTANSSFILPPKFGEWRRVRISPLAQCIVCHTTSVSAVRQIRMCGACEKSMETSRARILKDIAKFESAFGVKFALENKELSYIPDPTDSPRNEFEQMVKELKSEETSNSVSIAALDYDDDEDTKEEGTQILLSDTDNDVEVSTQIFETPAKRLDFSDWDNEEETEYPTRVFVGNSLPTMPCSYR